MIKKIVCILLASLLGGCAGIQTDTQHQKLARINAQLALAYLAQKDMQAAHKKLVYAQTLAPRDSSVWALSAYFWETAGNLAQADQDYRKAIALAPLSGATQNNYGVFLCRQKRYRLALSYFMAATKLSRYLHKAKAYQNAGYCARKIPDPALSDHYFQLAKKIQNLPE